MSSKVTEIIKIRSRQEFLTPRSMSFLLLYCFSLEICTPWTILLYHVLKILWLRRKVRENKPVTRLDLSWKVLCFCFLKWCPLALLKTWDQKLTESKSLKTKGHTRLCTTCWVLWCCLGIWEQLASLGSIRVLRKFLVTIFPCHPDIPNDCKFKNKKKKKICQKKSDGSLTFIISP